MVATPEPNYWQLKTDLALLSQELDELKKVVSNALNPDPPEFLHEDLERYQEAHSE